MLRKSFVFLHRWVGLSMALFLIIEGVTGSLLAFNADLTRLLNPALTAKRPAPDAKPLDLATLIERAEAQEPQKQHGYFGRVGDDQVFLRMGSRIDPQTGKPFEEDAGIVVVDPWTGKELAKFPYGGYTQGFLPNIMPFVYDLHLRLAIGGVGGWILSVVAILWTIDCFVGFYLTLPLALEKFWRRWKPAWLVKWRAGAHRINFDLHRSGGLWLWAMLFVFAWSSVNLAGGFGVYEWVTGKLFDYQSPLEEIQSLYPHRAGEGPQKLDLRSAQTVAERLVAEQATREGFKLGRPVGLMYFNDSRLYSYSVQTDRTFPNDKIVTMLFDGDTGAFQGRFQTSTSHTGNTISNWLRALHMITDPVDYLAYRIFVAVIGLVIVILSVTGVYVWWKKRAARIHRPSRAPASRLIEGRSDASALQQGEA